MNQHQVFDKDSNLVERTAYSIVLSIGLKISKVKTVVCILSTH